MSTTFYRIPLLITYIFFCFFLQGCAFYSEKNKEDLNISNKNWSDTAVQDIKRIHEILSETHPAKLDTSNHEFNNWLDFVGYKESMLLAERSESEQQAFSALKFYLTGFMDEHLSVGTYADQKDPLSWAGWHMEHSNGRYLVASRAIGWSVDLPQIGDEVISCDSISIHEILHNNVAPFVDRRIHLENTLNKLARYITIEQANSPLWETLRPTKCLFQKLSGKYQEIPLIWKKQPKNLKIKRPPPPPQGMHQIKKGIYWIHASNFKLNTEEHIDFDHFLNNIQSIDNADAIILDTRGNNGGNSMVGSAILSAALKKSAPPYQNSKAYWRISPISMATIDGHRESALKIEGKDSQIYKWLNDLRESMEVATQRGENFVEQADITSEDDTEIPQGWPPFQGKLILITDSYCFSACLDFVDEVMSVPGALHVGSTTDADTRYMDIGSAVLPSGLKIWIPLKVWVGRRRQDNVPYIPQIKYHQDINDTKALQAWVLQSILLVAKNIGTP